MVTSMHSLPQERRLGDREAGRDSSAVQEDFAEIGAARVVKVFSNGAEVDSCRIGQPGIFTPAWHFGRGSASAESSAARLQDAFARKGGFLATMDWAAAYDRMRPSITSAAFRQLGLPEPLAKLFLEAWGNRVRWVSWAGHVHYTPLFAGSATPQGCPLAPFCLSLWASSGVRCVETSVADRNAVLSCFLDDRSC